MRGSRGGGGSTGGPDPPENHKSIVFLSHTGPDPLENHKAAKPAFKCRSIIGPTAKLHLYGVSLKWADDIPILVVFGSSLPS